MNHPDLLRAYTANTFFYVLLKDRLEISSKNNTWTIRDKEGELVWSVQKLEDNKNLGIFNSAGCCSLSGLKDEYFYKGIKEWMDLKERL